MTQRIVVCDDEPAIADAVSYALERAGYAVDVAGDGEGALRLSPTADLLVLDAMLPDVSGFEICRALRKENDLPILMLTARDAESERILGLELGADDYVTKPFSVAEVVTRVRALLRRRELDRAGFDPTRRVGGLAIDPFRHTVEVDGRPVRLTPSEFKLLTLLASSPERAFARRELMQHLWDSSYVGDQRACDVHVSNLRAKIENDPKHPRRLLTVRGIGYRLIAV
ncbi:MAG TPA: response regulator transcription factor [Gaiellaceae bacterium]|jgi:DNA-binding response OmpR family regulator